MKEGSGVAEKGRTSLLKGYRMYPQQAWGERRHNGLCEVFPSTANPECTGISRAPSTSQHTRKGKLPARLYIHLALHSRFHLLFALLCGFAPLRYSSPLPHRRLPPEMAKPMPELLSRIGLTFHRAAILYSIFSRALFWIFCSPALRACACAQRWKSARAAVSLSISRYASARR